MIKAALNLAFKSFPNSAVEICVFCFLGVENRRAVETSADEQERLLEAAWLVGGMQFRAVFNDIMVDEAA